MTTASFHGPSALYVRASLVEIPEGAIVQVSSLPPPEDPPPSLRERLMGGLLVLSIVILAVFTAWLVVPQ